jgi:hypothetical protein
MTVGKTRLRNVPVLRIMTIQSGKPTLKASLKKELVQSAR